MLETTASLVAFTAFVRYPECPSSFHLQINNPSSTSSFYRNHDGKLKGRSQTNNPKQFPSEHKFVNAPSLKVAARRRKESNHNQIGLGRSLAKRSSLMWDSQVGRCGSGLG
jgi:hypothetical protein